ncbi:MAG: hypothetical protein D3908_05355 [Candidatus Electrothrix sp. AUS4]|nr:hypothetical protein [Candidatus Electrothrix sp. AUS4]
MNLLLSFTTGILTGLLLTGRNDSFIDSLRKWINETCRDNKKKREEIEDTIEKNLPDFHTWVKQGAERRRIFMRKIFFALIFVLAAILCIQYIRACSHENGQPPKTFQFNNTQVSAPATETPTPESTEETTEQ